jgi:hypothetical protein
MRFSERIGAVRRTIQKQSMDAALKNALWNVMFHGFWNDQLKNDVWSDHFVQPADEASLIPYSCSTK